VTSVVHHPPLTDRVPASADHVLIAVNPLAGRESRRGRIEELTQRLTGRGILVAAETNLAAVTERAAELASAGRLRTVVAAGGDGTVGELINRLPSDVPIATLAVGTENLLAQYLGMARSADVVAEAIAAGHVVRLDAGRANGRWFSLMLSCGLDVQIVEELAQGRRGNIHHLSYIRPIIRACRQYEYPEFRVYSDELVGGESFPRPDSAPTTVGERIRLPHVARFVQFINVPRYAFRLHFLPEASATDGLGHVCTFSGGGFWTTLGYYVSTWLGRQRRWTEMHVWTARKVRIECDRPAHYQLDGDPGGSLPVDVEIIPRRLSLIVPPQ
jgi:diacylglycerol kinase (ATP)